MVIKAPRSRLLVSLVSVPPGRSAQWLRSFGTFLHRGGSSSAYYSCSPSAIRSGCCLPSRGPLVALSRKTLICLERAHARKYRHGGPEFSNFTRQRFSLPGVDLTSKFDGGGTNTVRSMCGTSDLELHTCACVVNSTRNKTKRSPIRASRKRAARMVKMAGLSP